MAAGAIILGGLRLAGAAELLGGGPEDPIADGVAGVILLGAGAIALGDIIYNGLAAPPGQAAGPRQGSGSSLPGPSKGDPANGSLSEDDGAGNGTIRDYGPDGKPVKDTDFGHDHPAKDGTFSGDPHCHDWAPDKNGQLRRGGARPISPGE